jgi:hypothetical protein
MPVTETVSWTVVDDDGIPIDPVEGFLAHLTASERSPDTVRAHAVSLKLFFEFLARIGVCWEKVGPEQLARFVGDGSGEAARN